MPSLNFTALVVPVFNTFPETFFFEDMDPDPDPLPVLIYRPGSHIRGNRYLRNQMMLFKGKLKLIILGNNLLYTGIH
jgi:hypothetical protein